MEATSASEGKDPSAFLGEITGAPVTVKLNSGVVYKGELQSVDGYMNIALEKTEEYVNGKMRRSYGDAFYSTYQRTRSSSCTPEYVFDAITIQTRDIF
ncbi:U6 snRNA-associated Sm-like protein [Trichophyton mentagrophytes]|nr:U6 snRNA-associated Sm-like protein [Trichophyton mentagrophytes]